MRPARPEDGDDARSTPQTTRPRAGEGQLMTYSDGLTAEQSLQMDGAIGTFLDSYATHRLTPHQRTVIFFPGGMGSELVRANRAYNPGLPTGSYGFETVWVDLAKVFF